MSTNAQMDELHQTLMTLTNQLEKNALVLADAAMDQSECIRGIPHSPHRLISIIHDNITDSIELIARVQTMLPTYEED